MSEFKSVDAWAAYRDDGTLIEVCVDWGNLSHRTNAVDIRPVTISPRAEWVKVSERLPELHKYVLAYFPSRPWLSQDPNIFAKVVRRVPAEIYGNNHLPFEWKEFGPSKFFGQEASHWMPLPQAPEGE